MSQCVGTIQLARGQLTRCRPARFLQAELNVR
jgi:hypothetical protein